MAQGVRKDHFSTKEKYENFSEDEQAESRLSSAHITESN